MTQLPPRSQRAVLDRAHEIARSGSLIPPGRLYVGHLNVYTHQVSRAGFSKLHGLRHA